MIGKDEWTERHETELAMDEAQVPESNPAQRWMEAKARKEEFAAKLGFKAYAVGPGQDIPSPELALTVETAAHLQLLEQEEKEAFAACEASARS